MQKFGLRLIFVVVSSLMGNGLSFAQETCTGVSDVGIGRACQGAATNFNEQKVIEPIAQGECLKNLLEKCKAPKYLKGVSYGAYSTSWGNNISCPGIIELVKLCTKNPKSCPWACFGCGASTLIAGKVSCTGQCCSKGSCTTVRYSDSPSLGTTEMDKACTIPDPIVSYDKSTSVAW